MRFSVLHALPLPRPWAPGDEHRLVTETLEQVALADRLGFHRAWLLEHHFEEERAHASAAPVLLAACAAQTNTIRLGLGLTPQLRHPALVAEQLATLDLVSGGRADLATAEPVSGAEVGGFGIERATRDAAHAAALDAIARMLVETPFAGTDTMPPRNVVPKPLQRPHPPLWLTCRRRDAIRTAAERGLGALSVTPLEPDDARAAVAEYERIVASERCVPAGFTLDTRVAVAVPAMVHADEAEAIERGIDGAHFDAYARLHYEVSGEHAPGRTSLWDEFQRRRDDAGLARSAIVADGAPLQVRVLRNGLGSLRGAIGTPDQIRELARRYEQAGVDELVLRVQSGRTRHEHVREALELLAAEVLPEFAARHAAAEAARTARLGPAELRALARRPPRHEPDPDYRFRADDDGGPPEHVAAPPAAPPTPPGPLAAARSTARAAALRVAFEQRARRAFTSFVRRSDDRRLERTLGSSRALPRIFAAMTSRFRPDRAAGFTGEIEFDLRTRDGATRTWTIVVDGDHAAARAGAVTDAPALKLSMTVADLLRIGAGELDPGAALLSGRLDLEGDFALALRLGQMFGAPSSR